MRKQELKSRKKVHANKVRRKELHTQPYHKKEYTFVEYKPEVISLEILRNPRSNRKKVK